MISKINAFGKFLDQPILISKLERSMPLLLGTGATIALIKESRDIFRNSADKNEAKKTILSRAIVLYSAVVSALFAPKIASKITKRPPCLRLMPLRRIIIN